MAPVTPLRIGNVALESNLLLAPIAGYCDLAFRLVARSCGGVGMACTDLLCPEGVLRENRKSMELAMTCPADVPLCMQLYGGNVDLLCEAARWAEDRGAHVIDINMGCPVDKITKRDGGSKLLCDPDRTLRMVERVIRVLRHSPLTAKLRLGWDDTCIVAPYMASRLEQAGVKLVTIHGRTTKMMFTGQARLDGIAEVVAAVKEIPVVGNGDVKTPEDAKRMIEHTKCAGIMIGRGALSAPWLFKRTWHYLTTGEMLPEPTIEEKCRVMRNHFANIARSRGEQVAVIEFRKRISWYAKTMDPAKPLKEMMRLMNSYEEFDHAIKEFLRWRVEHEGSFLHRPRPYAVTSDAPADAIA
jgi:nifR3 family TIM-barrel protein